MLNFDVSPEDSALIDKIADRAQERDLNLHTRKTKDKSPYMHLVMDLTVAHNACPLDLERFLAAPEYDFAHDVLGIQEHINRETGALEDCFLPRYAKREATA